MTRKKWHEEYKTAFIRIWLEHCNNDKDNALLWAESCQDDAWLAKGDHAPKVIAEADVEKIFRETWPSNHA
jgi:hypothetical protein